MPATHTVTITVRRPAGTDRYGDPLPFTTHEIPGCIVAPSTGDAGQATSQERTDVRDTVITGHTVYAPYGADILAIDEVRVPGDPTWWQVEGDVANWASPFTNWQPGTQVALRRVRG